MPQENTDYNESSFGNAAPFLYMQADQPPGGSGGTTPSTSDAPDTGTTDTTIADEPAPAPSTTDATAPADQPPGGSGG